MALALTLLLSVLLVSLLLQVILLWAIARVFRVPASGRRLILTGLGVVLVMTPIGIAQLAASSWPLAAVGLLVLQLVVFFVVLGKGLQSSFGKTLLVGVTLMIVSTLAGMGLVSLVKPYVAEGFVLPTGAMAETLLGYHKEPICPRCGCRFHVNASHQAERGIPAMGGTCPNCRVDVSFASPEEPPLLGGDRILVTKVGWSEPRRWQVFVFTYPPEPVVRGMPMNYVFRTIGLPGDTIAISGGDLYVDDQPRQAPPAPTDPETGQPVYFNSVHSWPDDPAAMEAFTAKRFRILRKPPETMLVMRQLVHDNDCQPRALAAARWQAEPAAGWQPDDAARPRSFTVANPAAEMAWLHYRHLLPGSDKPALVTDFSAYNSSVPNPSR